jgi:hypothetical protein
MMADAVTQQLTKETFMQFVRSGFPVNPIGGHIIGSENGNRVMTAMRMYQWQDPRFVTESEALERGWEIDSDAVSVQARVRDSETGKYDLIKLFNASNVKGMPTLDAMLAMSDVEFLAMRGDGHIVEVPEDIEMRPVRQLEESIDGHVAKHGEGKAFIAYAPENGWVGGQSKIGWHYLDERHGYETVGPFETYSSARGDAARKGLEIAWDAPAPEVSASGRYAFRAPYWIDGYHNIEGIRIADELNAVIREKGCCESPDALKRLLDEKGKPAYMFELEVVPEEELERDPHYRQNAAQPRFLLDGSLVRDKSGSYRPKSGGVTILEDKGDSIVVKKGNEASFKAAIELAAAKGWSAIELTGKGPKLANAWLEARLCDPAIEVINYKPSPEDEKKLADKLAERAAKEQAERDANGAEVDDSLQIRGVMQQSPEMVENKLYVDENGEQKTATIVYTVMQQGEMTGRFNDAKAAAQAFDAAPASLVPSVVRSVVRAEGELIEEDVMVAGTSRVNGELVKAADATLDREFSGALAEIHEKDRVEASLEKPGQGEVQEYSGRILRIEDNYVVQKVGRDPSQIKRHELTKLSRIPTVGEVETIRFGKNGIGVVVDRGQAVSLER